MKVRQNERKTNTERERQTEVDIGNKETKKVRQNERKRDTNTERERER
jgi:hypothetical protein